MSDHSEPKARPKRRLAWWMRWLHTYVSMLGFASLVFFSVTGITLNHADWFEGGAARVVESEGVVPTRWTADEVDDLAIVEHLRREHRVRGSVHEFLTDDDECSVVLKGPGYGADAIVDRETGRYTLVENLKGPMALLNDLHKGRDSGEGWAWYIDISAGVLAVAGVTGAWLLWYVRKRRVLGIVAAALGTAVPVWVYLLTVR